MHPTKNILASCSNDLDYNIKLWNTHTGTELWTFRGHSDRCVVLIALF